MGERGASKATIKNCVTWEIRIYFFPVSKGGTPNKKISDFQEVYVVNPVF